MDIQLDIEEKKVIKLAKGYFGTKHKLYKTAHEQVMHSMAYAIETEELKKKYEKIMDCTY